MDVLIIVDVGEFENYKGTISPNNLGTETVTLESFCKATPTINELSFSLDSNTYTGNPNGIGNVTAKANIFGLGTIAVYYEGTDGTDYTKSTTAPTGIGTYTVTVNITEGWGYLAENKIELGEYSIIKKMPVVANLNFDLLSNIYNGSPNGIGEVTAKESIEGLGTITIYYEGIDGTVYTKSTTAPTAAGKYSVTVDISEGSLYHAVLGMALGTYTIEALPDDSLDMGLIIGITAGVVAIIGAGILCVVLIKKKKA